MTYRITKGEDLREQGYMGLHTVGRGSERSPVLLALDYNPTGDKEAPVYACLVGKGITFDSGGYSIKQTAFMDSMKSDMGGAATVTGALAFAITRGLNKRVKLFLCCADNLISGNAFKLGDIITYRNGKKVEVMNTDAEGRLVLADGLIDASAQKPELIIDAATLTGAANDSGGYSIKQTAFMDSMKSDMGGAATVTGALAFAITRGLNKRVKLFLCCADNLISGNAFKLGDIITYRNGKKVEVMNTDAEGRLVLADGLIDASAQKPELIIDAATLTGAAKTALGNDYHALFSFDDALAGRLLASASQENEPFWRLPLAEFHRNQLPSNFAELNNTGSAAYPAGASTAAGFLSHFVENYQQGRARRRASCRTLLRTISKAGCISTARRLTVKRRLNSGLRVLRDLVCARLLIC